jgi:hypothetical protein
MDAMRAEVARLISDEVPAALPWERPTADSNKDRATNYTAKSDRAEYVVSRLKRDDPELAERVVNGEISANTPQTAGWCRMSALTSRTTVLWLIPR